MKKALFLYTELADYTISAFRALTEKGVELHVVRWPVNSEAPFLLEPAAGIHFYERNDHNRESLLKMIDELRPDLIYSAGWMDKTYIQVCKSAPKEAVKVIGLDNKWKGSLKQVVAGVIGHFTISRIFDYAFVPGELQFKYARKLGFSSNRIYKGLYTADVAKFDGIYKNSRAEKEKEFPRRFIYIGRYVQFKGIFDLWKAFTELHDEGQCNWELWCIGTGELFNQKVNHPAIKHFGFVQPNELGAYLKQAGVYILPSHVEPWAVSLHEMTAAGLPVICSNEVGAAEVFVEEGRNGFLFPAAEVPELKSLLRKICSTDPGKLSSMSAESNRLGTSYTPEDWAQKVIKMMHKNHKGDVRN